MLYIVSLRVSFAVVVPPVSAKARPHCLSHSSVNGVQRPASASSPRSNHLVILPEPDERSGVLASITAHELGVGTQSCPWLIVAAPGQRINITVMDFGDYERRSPPADNRSRRDLSPTGHTGQSRRRQHDPAMSRCREYAVLSEDTATKNVVVCSDHWPRIRLVYTSKSHRLKVTFSGITSSSTDADDDRRPYFAIKYEGCTPVPFSSCVTRFIVTSSFCQYLTVTAQCTGSALCTCNCNWQIA